MSYKDRFGITEIFRRKRGESFEALSISWDCETSKNMDDREERVGMFLYVPSEAAQDHDHIAFDLNEAKILKEWLNDYIEDLENHNVKEVKNFHL